MSDTGFISKGTTVDLVTIFEPGSGGPATNFIGKDSYDLNTRFAPFVAGGTNADETGYKVGNTDLSELFMKKGNDVVNGFANLIFISSTSASFTYTGNITSIVSLVYEGNTVTSLPVMNGNTYTITGLPIFIHGIIYKIIWNQHSCQGLYVGEFTDFQHVMMSTGDENNDFNIYTYGLSSYVPRINPEPGRSLNVGGIIIKSVKLSMVYPDDPDNPNRFYLFRLEGAPPYIITNQNDHSINLYPNHTTSVTPMTTIPASFSNVSWQSYFYIRILVESTCIFSGFLYCNLNSLNGSTNIAPIWRVYELVNYPI